MKIKVVITLLFGLFFLSACGGGGGGNDPATPAASELEGTWVSNLCEVQNDGSFAKEFLTLTGTNIVSGQTIFTDANCAKDINHSQPNFHGKFTVGNTITLSGVPAKEIDILSPTYNATLYSVYSLQNGKLVFGDISTTPEERPQVLSSTEYYTKNNLVSLTTELEGDWFGSCTATGNGDYGKILVAFTGYETTVTATLYNDAVCTDSISISIEQLKVVIGNTITTPLGDTVTELDIYNSDYSPYGYDIYSIGGGKLVFGDDTGTYYDGSTPEQRPIELSSTESYTKTSNLQGTWVTDCFDVAEGVYGKMTRDINGSSVTDTVSGYSDSSCNTLLGSSTPEYYKIVIGNPVTTTSGKSATELNVTPLNGDTENYDIYSIIDGKLYFGDSPGTSAATRPETLDLVIFFTKI